MHILTFIFLLFILATPVRNFPAAAKALTQIKQIQHTVKRQGDEIKSLCLEMRIKYRNPGKGVS